MRLLHTADWHLGRIFHGRHLTEDQAYLMDQIVDLVREIRPDAFLLAGDVYDRAVPPPEAVSLLDDVLYRLVLDLGTRVILVAGNHDSPERLGFASRVLGRQGLHVFGNLASLPSPVILEDEHGPVTVHAVPYIDPPVAREWLGGLSGEGRQGQDDLGDHDQALRAVLSRLEQGLSASRSVLVTHAYVAGGTVSESERPLSVGGAGTVAASAFGGWNYVALGHLHRAQAAGGDHIRYSGSLFPYSFDEAGQVKVVNFVELNGEGASRVEGIPLRPRREVRKVSGVLSELLAARPGVSSEDYLMVTLLDEGPVYDAMGRLREVYPNILHLERAGLFGSRPATGEQGQAIGPGRDHRQAIGPGRDHRQFSERDLFAHFYRDVTGSELTAGESETLDSVLESLAGREREVPV